MLRKMLSLILLCTVACGGAGKTPGTHGSSISTTRVPTGEKAQVAMYIRQIHDIDPAILWSIRKVALRTADGSQIDFATEHISVDTDELAGGQRLLAVADAAPGDYAGITIFTEGALLKPRDKPMLVENSILNVDHSFSAVAGDCSTLILLLSHAVASGGAQAEFRPFVETEKGIQRPSGKLVYVANENSMNVSVVDKAARRVVYNVYIGARPTSLGADNRRGRLYICDRRSGTIYEMDMTSQHLINVTELDYVDEPVHVEPVPEKDIIMVVNYGSDSVHLLDSFTLQVVSTVDVGRKPIEAIYSRVWDLAFVLSSLHGTLSVLNLETTPTASDTTIQVELRPSGMAINEADDWLYVSNEGSTDISVIKMETLGVERSITVGTGVTDVAFDPYGRRLYVAFGYSREVKCIDPYTEVEVFSLRMKVPPTELLFDPDEKRLYALLPEANSVAVINPMTQSLESVIETGSRPSDMALRP